MWQSPLRSSWLDQEALRTELGNTVAAAQALRKEARRLQVMASVWIGDTAVPPVLTVRIEESLCARVSTTVATPQAYGRSGDCEFHERSKI